MNCLEGNPLISVVIPAYNCEKTINDSIYSIINQTYKNLEIIVINDGSIDKTKLVVDKIIKCDKRVKQISIHNKGISNAINLGISISKGEWICRMDSDDISVSNRIELQLEYARKNKLDIVGCWIKLFDQNNIYGIRKYPITDSEIRCQLLFNSPFPHPGLLIRKKIFDTESYDGFYRHIEDYELWCRLGVDKNIKMGNLPLPLILYRVSSNQVHRKNKNILFKIRSEIAKKYLEAQKDSSYPRNLFNLYHKFIPLSFNKDLIEIKELEIVLLEILNIKKASQYLEYEVYKSNLKKTLLCQATFWLLINNLVMLFAIFRLEIIIFLIISVLPIFIKKYIFIQIRK